MEGYTVVNNTRKNIAKKELMNRITPGMHMRVKYVLRIPLCRRLALREVGALAVDAVV